jgi:hypothetical protein
MKNTAFAMPTFIPISRAGERHRLGGELVAGVLESPAAS